MKLVNTTRFVNQIHNLGRAERNNRRPVCRPSAHAPDLTRLSNRLVARWHLCPETNRLECAWSLEPVLDDQLCHSRAQPRRQVHCRRLMRSAKPTSRVSPSVSALGHKQTCAAHAECPLWGKSGHFSNLATVALVPSTPQQGTRAISSLQSASQ